MVDIGSIPCLDRETFYYELLTFPNEEFRSVVCAFCYFAIASECYAYTITVWWIFTELFRVIGWYVPGSFSGFEMNFPRNAFCIFVRFLAEVVIRYQTGVFAGYAILFGALVKEFIPSSLLFFDI